MVATIVFLLIAFVWLFVGFYYCAVEFEEAENDKARSASMVCILLGLFNVALRMGTKAARQNIKESAPQPTTAASCNVESK